MWFESTPGKGSTFYFTIAAVPPGDRETNTKSNTAAFIGKHIGIMSNRTNLSNLIQKQLGLIGVRSTILEGCKTLPVELMLDLIIVDTDLSEWAKQNIPPEKILWTGNIHHAYCKFFLKKPITPLKLISALNSYFGGTLPQAAEATPK